MMAMDGNKSFATVTYAEVESAGPPSAPLGFPAPIVAKSEITSVKYLDFQSKKCSEGTALLSASAEHKDDDAAYLLTAVCLKQTICGVVMKGIVLRRRHLSVESNDPIVWESTDEYVAIKIDKRSVMQRLHNGKCIRNPENPWKEISAMQLLGKDHPNIIGLLGAFSDDQCLYEVMPYCSGGNLSTYIHQNYPKGLPEAKAMSLFRQILDGLYYMHSKGVCHHDLSTNNILLNGVDNDSCIIIDFGMSLRVPYSYPDDPAGVTDDVTDITIGTKRRLMHTHTFCGKLHFIAPEIYNKADQFDGPAADVWSLGVILFILLTGKEPYQKPDINDEGYHDLIDPNYYWNPSQSDPNLSWGREISSHIITLLHKMLCPEVANRATLGWVRVMGLSIYMEP